MNVLPTEVVGKILVTRVYRDTVYTYHTLTPKASQRKKLSLLGNSKKLFPDCGRVNDHLENTCATWWLDFQ